jgi:hypothetical protein
VGDRHDGLLGPSEQRPQGVADAFGHVHAALPSPGARDVGLVRPGPRAVGGERPSLVPAEADLVETLDDEPLDVAAVEREVERLLRATEARRDPEVDGLVREQLAERERLLDAEVGEALSRRDRADPVVRVRARVRVTNQQQPPQNSTLRYASVCRMPTVS